MAKQRSRVLDERYPHITESATGLRCWGCNARAHSASYSAKRAAERIAWFVAAHAACPPPREATDAS